MAEDSSILASLVKGDPVTVPLEVLRPEQLLRSLNEQPMPVRVTIGEGDERLELDVGNGFVMGASSEEDGVTPAVALERFLGMEGGVAELEPTRFLQMANLICPIEKVLGEKRAYVTKTLRVQPSVPESQAVPTPEPDAVHKGGSWSFATAGAAGGFGIRHHELSETDIVMPEAQRRWTTWAIAAACVLALALGAIGGLWAARADASPNPVRHVKAVGIGPLDQVRETAELAPAPEAVEEEAAEPSLVDDVRALIRAGELREALALAERGVEQRPGRADVQLVLGDTRLANGQRAAALRAWRRALHLRPNYRAAERRLDRHAG